MKLINKKKHKVHTFEFKKCFYNFISRTKGKEKNINKHDLPPPLDNLFLYGNIIVIKTDSKNNFINLTKKDYLEFYEDAFGGFEDLGSEDTDTDSEGYVKIEEEDYNPNLEDWENEVDYDKYYNQDNKDDEFVSKNESSLEEEISENDKSFDDEEETESDEEIKQYLEDNLYDSD